MEILAGFFLPPLIGLVVKHLKDTDLRFWVSSAICAIFGILATYISTNGFVTLQGLSLQDQLQVFIPNIMAMIGIVKLSYEAVWNNQKFDRTPLEILKLT